MRVFRPPAATGRAVNRRTRATVNDDRGVGLERARGDRSGSQQEILVANELAICVRFVREQWRGYKEQ